MTTFITSRLGAPVIAALIGFSSISSADPITYAGSIGTAGDPTGSVIDTVAGYGWDESVASAIDFWSFSVGTGGGSYDIWAIRGDDDLDPALSLFSGITSADESEYDSYGDFADLVLIDIADDEIAAPSGPFEDPALYSIFLDEGDYTIAIGGYASDGDGPFSYQLFIDAPGSAPAPVPLPAAFWLLASAGIGLLGMRRRA